MMTPTRLTHSNRLRWFLSSVVVASIIIPALIVGIYEISSRFQSDMTVRTQEQASALLEVLKKGLNPPLWSFFPENAELLLDGVALNQAINKISVFDSDGELFVEYIKDAYTDEPDALLLDDVIQRDGETIGSLILEFSLEPARQQAWQDTQRVFFITSIQVIVSLSVILFLIHWRVSQPLAQLKLFAHEVASKNFSINIKINHDDEFADLANELDTMRIALKESFENLEERVTERTEELTLVNAELTDTVTRLEEAKDNLVQTEKLAALGSLVAGVSHELNTPIGNGRVMSSSLHDTAIQLKDLFDSGQMTKSHFENGLGNIIQGSNLIERNLLKAINLVQSFKKIAVDRTSDNRRSFYLNEFIVEIESTMSHIFKSTPYRLVVELGEDVELNSYPGELSQVISNLINNSMMHGFENQPEGVITITTSHTTENSVVIRVADDGLGMSQDTQKHIFEPFFTTKMGKGGSGLGMHIVHNLITGSLGGQITIQTELRVGTTISLTLPLDAPNPEK